MSRSCPLSRCGFFGSSFSLFCPFSFEPSDSCTFVSCVLSFVPPFLSCLVFCPAFRPTSVVYLFLSYFLHCLPRYPPPLSYSLCCPFVSSLLSCVSLFKFYIRYLQFNNIGRSVLWIRIGFSADPDPQHRFIKVEIYALTYIRIFL